MQLTVFQILTILLGGVASAREVMTHLGEMSERDVPSLATFYRHLKSGLDAGWVAIATEERPGQRRGRPQQHYRITASGKKAAAHEALRLRSLSDLALRQIGDNK